MNAVSKATILEVRLAEMANGDLPDGAKIERICDVAYDAIALVRAAESAPSPSTPIDSVDPYAITLEPGESVVREGYAVLFEDGVYRGDSDSKDPSKARLYESTGAIGRHYTFHTLVHITIIRSPERRDLVPVEAWGWLTEDGEIIDPTPVLPAGVGWWRPIRITPGTERAVVRRLVPGPVVEP